MGGYGDIGGGRSIYVHFHAWDSRDSKGRQSAAVIDKVPRDGIVKVTFPNGKTESCPLKEGERITIEWD